MYIYTFMTPPIDWATRLSLSLSLMVSEPLGFHPYGWSSLYFRAHCEDPLPLPGFSHQIWCFSELLASPSRHAPLLSRLLSIPYSPLAGFIFGELWQASNKQAPLLSKSASKSGIEGQLHNNLHNMVDNGPGSGPTTLSPNLVELSWLCPYKVQAINSFLAQLKLY